MFRAVKSCRKPFPNSLCCDAGFLWIPFLVASLSNAMTLRHSILVVGLLVLLLHSGLRVWRFLWLHLTHHYCMLRMPAISLLISLVRSPPRT